MAAVQISQSEGVWSVEAAGSKSRELTSLGVLVARKESQTMSHLAPSAPTVCRAELRTRLVWISYSESFARHVNVLATVLYHFVSARRQKLISREGLAHTKLVDALREEVELEEFVRIQIIGEAPTVKK